jgi:peptidoglycan/xylan/chitin deacetylase (PgdA/CDA1 family)
MKTILPSFFIGLFLIVGCQSKPDKTQREIKKDKAEIKNVSPKKTIADLATILSKKEVPILCYHRIRNILASDGEDMKTYSVTPAAFADQMKALHDNGFQTILPDQLYNYLVQNGPLPRKPVLITFDDTREEQYRIGMPEMNKYGYKGVFFIMTVSINRPGYMSKDQIKSLSDSGHIIAAHTWDHHNVKKYEGSDWETQLAKPKKKLEAITGKPVNYFAYPFGLWNKKAIPKIKSNGYRLAFILSTKRDSTEPLYTIRRIIVSGRWSTQKMLEAMNSTFNK